MNEWSLEFCFHTVVWQKWDWHKENKFWVIKIFVNCWFFQPPCCPSFPSCCCCFFKVINISRASGANSDVKSESNVKFLVNRNRAEMMENRIKRNTGMLFFYIYIYWFEAKNFKTKLKLFIWKQTQMNIRSVHRALYKNTTDTSGEFEQTPLWCRIMGKKNTTTAHTHTHLNTHFHFHTHPSQEAEVTLESDLSPTAVSSSVVMVA